MTPRWLAELQLLLEQLQRRRVLGLSREPAVILDPRCLSSRLAARFAAFQSFGGQLIWLPETPERLLAVTVELRFARPLCGLLISRAGRDARRRRQAVNGMRKATESVLAMRGCGLVNGDSPLGPAMLRLLARRGCRSLRVDARGARNWSRWLAAIESDPGAAVYVSPAVELSRTHASPRPLPLGDCIVAGFADRLLSPFARPRGNIVRLLDAAERSGVPVGDLTPSSREPMGKVTWQIDAVESQTERRAMGRAASGRAASGRAGSSKVARRLLAGDYLLHCTRAPRDAWPSESPRQYLDELLAGGSPRDALATLKRILDGRKLLASSRAIRGSAGVVCFSAAPLSALSRLRTFRRHRGRWDFEPYGLLLSRQRVVAFGAARVHYGGDRDWRRLSAAERPFFQVERSGADDWTAEQEWRLVGDLPLQPLLDDDDALAFTATRAEAEWLRSRTAFAVLELPTLLQLADRRAALG